MNCTECKEKLVEYIEGLLPESQKLDFESHLKGCRICRAELQELTALQNRIASNSKNLQQLDFEDAVFSRIIREQNQRLKQADRISRQLKIWRIIMKSKIAKIAAAAIIIIAAALTINIFHKSIPTASASELLQEAINAVSDLWSVHMKTRMRTSPSENFSFIALNYDFVPIEMWKRTDENGLVQWRVEKAGRVLLMDGHNTTMLIRPNHGVLMEKPLPLGCFDSWSGRLLNVSELLDSELQNAKNKPDREVFLHHEGIDGQDKIILEVEVAANVPEGDYLRNTFIASSDHSKIYRFDVRTKLLEGLQVYVNTEDKDVLIFEITDIEYNTEIDDKLFAIALPKDVVWWQEPEILPDNEKYEKMSPKEAATAFFQACADENWDEALKFWSSTQIDDQFKKHLGGLTIISIGEPFQSAGYASEGLGWFVPYEIRLKHGEVRKMNLAIRKDNPAKRFVVDGGL